MTQIKEAIKGVFEKTNVSLCSIFSDLIQEQSRNRVCSCTGGEAERPTSLDT